ncbi:MULTISPECIES: VOC family protein [Mesorhizobium]|uniref:VOC family protein n=1 Tax=Mesorhizobium denitrificans TaxID=2294114 RepID=A0A371X8X3_9HYPH|nr:MULTISPECIES: VOC family protein [Mesorhizobium]RFC65673.1 VOC family protein [Mesorhizobium denitrificans]
MTGKSNRGLPGLRGAEHIGITVPDFDDAVDFFVRVIGCEFILDGGEYADPDFMERQIGVDRSSRFRWGFVRCKAGPNFEIFEYVAPDQEQAPPRNSDIGGHHIAFYVDDIDAAIAHLREQGVTVLGEIQHIESGPAKGSLWVYFLAPWGLQMELVSYPDGKGASDSPARRLWHPARPDR